MCSQIFIPSDSCLYQIVHLLTVWLMWLWYAAYACILAQEEAPQDETLFSRMHVLYYSLNAMFFMNSRDPHAPKSFF